MKRIIRIFVLTTFINVVLVCYAFADIINIPADYSTIQAGINAASNGDTVLVQPGTYVENINYNGKNITVGSLFLTTADISYISQTIIDGNQNGSVVTFENGEENTSVLTGFTITNGLGSGTYPTYYGGGVTFKNYSNPTLDNLFISGNFVTGKGASNGGGIHCHSSNPILNKIIVSGNSVTWDGGGIYFHYSDPILTNFIIYDNSAGSSGGGICCYYSNPQLSNVTIRNNMSERGGGSYFGNSNAVLTNVTICNNYAFGSYVGGGGIICIDSNISLSNVSIFCNITDSYGGGIYSSSSDISFSPYNRCNIYCNNASSGSDLYNNNCPITQVIVDTFTVLVPADYHAHFLSNFTFDILSGKISQENSDLYVDPINGDNNNCGLSAVEPLLNINFALSKVIIVDSLFPHSIYLTPGVYSPFTNGEIYPLNCRSYVNIIGNNADNTILNAEQMSGVLCCDSDISFSIINIQITGGDDSYGGGIYLKYSNPDIIDVKIHENTASSGGGIYCWHSNPGLSNSEIGKNAAYHGGAIYCDWSNPNLIGILINENSALYEGGAIYCEWSQPSLTNVTMVGNSAYYGGGLYCWLSCYPTVDNSIIWNNLPEEVFFASSLYCPCFIDVAFSDMQGGESGIVANNGTVNWLDGNIDADPLFIDPLNGDYHLSWANFPIQDSTKSPCIDAGDPTSPLDPDGTIADMGAYYFNQNVSVDDPQEMSNYMLTNYPNPISSSINNLTVSFSIHKSGKVKIQLFNVKGQLVSTLINGDKNVGEYTINYSVNDLSSGIYFTKLSIDGVDREIKKVVLLR